MNLDPGTATLTAHDWHTDRYGEEHERIAPTCHGPGHLLDEWDMRVEDCPECIGRGPRNHGTCRRVPA